MILSRGPLRSANAAYDVGACLFCQWRAFSCSYICLDQKPSRQSKPSPSPVASTTDEPPSTIPSPLEDAPRAYGRSHETFTPRPLQRPIGVPDRPQAGDNTGIDHRSLRQRRDDFVDYDKHLARRKQLTHKVASPYFREWDNMRFSKGKTFIAPPRIFKSDLALYFPNLRGQTLIKDKAPMDTTPLFEDKVSIVSVFSTRWAENQAATFVSEKSNPGLLEVIKASGGIAQMVQLNVEENWMKAMLVKLFMPSLRKTLGQEQWRRYFLIRKGFGERLREAIGLLNTKVGYIYVLDGNCKIRWAGSGLSEPEEREGLVRAVKRLVDDAKAPKTKSTTARIPSSKTDPRNTKEKPALSAA
ncbi:ATP10 protein-domain-containing protein [Amylocarpus encephaloides]|uniref:ATP10 protein-domain-containing protein n=1 Tax=Amylocarpus encephaloides TaxID=45428 RepID=A0A9P7YKV1_9HELO|nr:ATP10 protein-domain-containing protein [Amylocarpus encephaloides]